MIQLLPQPYRIATTARWLNTKYTTPDLFRRDHPDHRFIPHSNRSIHFSHLVHRSSIPRWARTSYLKIIYISIYIINWFFSIGFWRPDNNSGQQQHQRILRIRVQRPALEHDVARALRSPVGSVGRIQGMRQLLDVAVAFLAAQWEWPQPLPVLLVSTTGASVAGQSTQSESETTGGWWNGLAFEKSNCTAFIFNAAATRQPADRSDLCELQNEYDNALAPQQPGWTGLQCVWTLL